jgi:sugar transferase (PEP-CTERM/EpsH1 system associated)
MMSARSPREPAPSARPLIAHAVHRLDIGGMENGLVNLINGLPEAFADHAVIAFTDISPDFARRIRRPGVRLLALHKPPGQTARILPRLWRELRRLRPSIFHTRNLATLEGQTAAWLAGVPCRVHGEHGWDVGDLDGSSPGPLRLRRCLRPLVHHQVALSEPIRRYLTGRVGVADTRVSRICNGVDTARFAPRADRADLRARLAGAALPAETFVIGAVGRLAAVKNLPMLIEAFALAGARDARFRQRARLALVGDGPQRADLQALIAQRGLTRQTWMAGAREDIPDCLGLLDVLCLPSLAEGISNTVLEAMASGVPVAATAVGGNAELIEDGVSGWLVPSGDAPALAERLLHAMAHPDALRAAGEAARARAVTQFSLAAMLAGYHAMYAGMLAQPD